MTATHLLEADSRVWYVLLWCGSSRVWYPGTEHGVAGLKFGIQDLEYDVAVLRCGVQGVNMVWQF